MNGPRRHQAIVLGETLGRRPGRRFNLLGADRLFHMLVLGQTGTGKSTLIRNLVLQDIAQGSGVCLLDPHGDLAKELEDQLPPNAVYWDIADPSCSYGYNPLSFVSEELRPLVASGIIDALRSQWADAWGVRMEHLLRFAILALLSRRGSSIADIIPMYTNKSFRKEVLLTVTDRIVLSFWNDEFPKMNYKTAFDGVAPIANKLGAFLSNPVVRKSVCEPSRPIRFRKALDEGQVVVVNLAKGRLGADVSGVLGGLTLAMIANAALTRADLPPRLRQSFFVYVDEFAAFATEAIASMLSELRKYGVGLCLAGQYLSAAKPSIVDAILGNVGTVVAFRLGVTDAQTLGRALNLQDSTILNTQPNHRMTISLMINGERCSAFSAQSISPPRSGSAFRRPPQLGR